MLKEFLEVYEKEKHLLVKKYTEKSPTGYTEIVKDVLELINNKCDVEFNINNITETSNDQYHGDYLYVIPAEKDHYTETFYTVKVEYGSCSVCDTFEGIYGNERVKEYMQLALHILQNLKEFK